MNATDTIQDREVDTWKAEQAARKAERAAKREALYSDKARAAELAAHLLAVTARETEPNVFDLDLALVFGDLICDTTKDAIVFDVVGQAELVIERRKLREVAAELSRKRAGRGVVRCTLGDRLTFAWNTGRLALRSRKPCEIVCGQGGFCSRRHDPKHNPLTPENTLRVVIAPAPR